MLLTTQRNTIYVCIYHANPYAFIQMRGLRRFLNYHHIGGIKMFLLSKILKYKYKEQFIMHVIITTKLSLILQHNSLNSFQAISSDPPIQAHRNINIISTINFKNDDDQPPYQPSYSLSSLA